MEKSQNTTNRLEPRLTKDGSYTLYSPKYAQTFHSDKGALTESLHVFVQGSSLPQHLKQNTTVHLLEVGFGTGLNFFLSADAALQKTTQEATSQLNYVALEQHLLPSDILKKLTYDRHLENPELWQAYLLWRDGLTDETLHGTKTFAFENVTLRLELGEACHNITNLPNARFNIVYHDAFSFDANSELWQPKFLQQLHRCQAECGVLVSYSVKGIIRRNLQALGYKVEKRPGPANGKREMLLAIKAS